MMIWNRYDKIKNHFLIKGIILEINIINNSNSNNSNNNRGKILNKNMMMIRFLIFN